MRISLKNVITFQKFEKLISVTSIHYAKKELTYNGKLSRIHRLKMK